MERILTYYSTRKRSILSLLFYIFLFSLLVFEGWGIPYGSMIVRNEIILFPILFFVVSYLSGEKIHIPVRVAIVFIAFLICVSLSTIHSVNVATSVEQQLILISVFGIFFIANSFRSELLKGLVIFLIMSTGVSGIFFLLIRFFAPLSLYLVFSKANYQLLFIDKASLNHHPFGVLFLTILPILFVIAVTKRGRWIFYVTGFIFILFIFTYLRSAYVALATSLLMYFALIVTNSSKKLILMGITIALLSLLLILSTTSKNNYLSKTQTLLIEKTGAPIIGKTLFNLHDSFINQSLTGIGERPYLGWGGLSFPYVSLRYAQSLRDIGMNSHTQIIDITLEYGLLAGSLFVFFYFLIIKNGYSQLVKGSIQEKSAFLIFITLIIFFQLNFYYRSNYLFILMICLGAMIYKSKETIKVNSSIVILLLIVTAVAIMKLASDGASLKGNPTVALSLYPINEVALQQSLNVSLQENDERMLRSTIAQYLMFYGENRDTFLIIGDVYHYLKNYSYASAYYTHALSLSPTDYTIIQRIYESRKMYLPLNRAKKEAVHMLYNHEIIQRLPLDEYEILNSWCALQNIDCRKSG